MTEATATPQPPLADVALEALEIKLPRAEIYDALSLSTPDAAVASTG